MGRTVAVVWHALFSVAAGVLYFFFVIPRWPELVGQTSPTLGTVLRIVTGVVLGLAALPVVFTLLRTRRPELRTPELALNLRISSIGLHVLAGVLIVGTAISEIWLDLDSAGQWLFGIYGAAAAFGLLGIFAFYLAFVAELPPPPPKPLKVKEKKGRGRKTRKSAEDAEDATEATEPEETEEASGDSEPAETPEDEPASAETADEPAAKSEESTATADEPDEAKGADEPAEKDGKLRNRRPAGKSWSRKRKRSDGQGTDVAVDD